jgi:deoxyribonuclease-4
MSFTGSSAPLLLGAHLSIAGGLHKALLAAAALNCRALQIFTKNAATWQERVLTDTEIRAFQSARKNTGISAIAAHAAYLINPAASRKEVRGKSEKALAGEFFRCGQLELPWLILHPGSHTGDGPTTGIRRVTVAINRVLDSQPDNPTRLLLETTAGQGHTLGRSFEELAEMMEGVADPNRIGICLDTCHIFAAGYDLSGGEAYNRTMAEFDRVLGISRLHVIHVNDARKPCGSRVDRHAHIGEGMIGLEAFSSLLRDPRLRAVAKIIETPKEKDGENADPENLARLRALAGSVRG